MNNDIFNELSKSGIDVDEQTKDKIKRRLDEINSYTPTVGVFGKTGVGKSSLCNALFGSDICEISNVNACTRNKKEIDLLIGNKKIGIVDVPGIGEDGERDKEYAELYHKLLPNLDVILWVLKGDDRAFSSDETFYKQVVRPHIDQDKPFIIVLNQVDKIEPYREWNEEKRQPSENQRKNIIEKTRFVSSFFDTPSNNVIPVSANEKFGLIELTDAIIFSLPRDKRISISRVMPIENVSEKAIKEVEKSYLDLLLEYVPVVGPLIQKCVTLVRGWLKWR